MVRIYGNTDFDTCPPIKYHNQASERDTPDSNCPLFVAGPTGNPALKQAMIDATQPCGYYKQLGCDYKVIPANVVYPGEGVGDLAYKPYIVQFDIGVHSSIKDKVLNSLEQWDGDVPCIGCEEESETCLEIIVEGGSDATGGCAGKCGSGCSIIGGGYAKDCLKHDVCTMYKAIHLGIVSDYNYGFCFDPDCGDEAAQTIMNCYLVIRWWRDRNIICDQSGMSRDSKQYGHWSPLGSTFVEGHCWNFRDWASGQGIPNGNQIRNDYDFFRAYLEGQSQSSVKVSRE